MDRYFIVSTLNNNFLGALFEDKHNKLFCAKKPDNAYYYSNQEIAENIG